MKVLVFYRHTRLREFIYEAKMIDVRRSRDILDTFLNWIAKEHLFDVEITGYLPKCEKREFDDDAAT